jgi:hypothetical protein
VVDLDKPYFSSELRHFATVNRVSLSTEMVREYWDDLKGMTLPDFQHASAHLRRTAKWMPKPCEFWSARRVGWM